MEKILGDTDWYINTGHLTAKPLVYLSGLISGMNRGLPEECA